MLASERACLFWEIVIEHETPAFDSVTCFSAKSHLDGLLRPCISSQNLLRSICPLHRCIARPNCKIVVRKTARWKIVKPSGQELPKQTRDVEIIDNAAFL